MSASRANSAAWLHFNGWLFALCFGIAEGGNLATGIFASAQLSGTPGGEHIFTVTTAVLYLSFALGTLVAPAMGRLFTVKRAVVFGMACYTLPPLAWLHPKLYLTIPANIMEGLFGAMLWTYSGRYVTDNAKRYAFFAKKDETASISYFSNIFAGSFALMLALLKMVAGALEDSFGPEAPFAFGFSLCVVGVAGMCFIIDFEALAPACIDEAKGAGEESVEMVQTTAVVAKDNSKVQTPEQPPSSGEPGAAAQPSLLDTMLSVPKITFTDPKLISHMAFNATFSFIGPVAVVIVTGRIKATLGEPAVGYVWGISGLYAFVVSLAISQIKYKPAAIGVGVTGYLALLIPLMTVPRDDIGGWLVLVVLMCCYQTGQVVWEGAFFAVHADYYTGTPNLIAAFASYKFQNGVASSIAYFTFDYMTQATTLIICLVFTLLSLPCFMVGHVVFQREQAAKELIGGKQQPEQEPLKDQKIAKVVDV